jgi:hypothetical protein
VLLEGAGAAEMVMVGVAWQRRVSVLIWEERQRWRDRGGEIEGIGRVLTESNPADENRGGGGGGGGGGGVGPCTSAGGGGERKSAAAAGGGGDSSVGAVASAPDDAMARPWRIVRWAECVSAFSCDEPTAPEVSVGSCDAAPGSPAIQSDATDSPVNNHHKLAQFPRRVKSSLRLSGSLLCTSLKPGKFVSMSNKRSIPVT